MLVLYASTRLLPAVIEADHALRENIASTPERPVELYAEFLDLPRFSSPAFIQAFARYLHEKYTEHPPDVILTAGSDALDLVVRNRERLFPHTPVVYIASTKAL
ncbi:histidine kinase, partial [Lacticaseibacillus rhamnosus]